MHWYQTIGKRILSGAIFFLLPVVLLVFILGKAVVLVQNLILRVTKYLPDEPVLGMGLLTVISILFILLVCFVAGILSEGKRVKSLIAKLEDNVLVYVPGYSMMKSRATDAVTETDDEWRAVLVNEGKGLRPGIAVDRQPTGYTTVFFPSPPLGRSGTLKLIHESEVKNLDIPVSTLLKMVRKYGEGSGAWIKNLK